MSEDSSADLDKRVLKVRAGQSLAELFYGVSPMDIPFRSIILPSGEALSADPDGPLSPLPGRVLPQRIVPPLSFGAYRVMLGE